MVSGQSFWCSALSLSNDTMEGRWLRKVFFDLCEEDELWPKDQAYILNMIDAMINGYEGLGFCLSENGDMLSQWRGYAQNAEGFSIGFSKEALTSLSSELRSRNKDGIKVFKVNYDLAVQREELVPTFREIKKHIDDGAFRTPTLLEEAGLDEEERKRREQKRQELRMAISGELVKSFLPLLYQHKNPAFSEEAEWRAVSPFLKNRIRDVDFRVSGNSIVPYRVIPFDSSRALIKEVVIGPRNPTPLDVIEMALKRYGYSDVNVRKSEATYR